MPPVSIFFLLLAGFPWLPGSPEIGLSFAPYTRLSYQSLFPDEDPGGKAYTPMDTAFRDYFWTLHAAGRMPLMHMTWFPGRSVALGPEFSAIHVNNADEWGAEFNALYLGARCAFFPVGQDARKGIYLLGHSGLLGVQWYLQSDFDFSVGSGFGYLWRIKKSATIGIEGRYARWIDNGIHDVSVLVRTSFKL